MSENRPADAGTWRDRALERSLGEARAEALARSTKFISAAMDLLQTTGNTDFTVQHIVEASHLSLRSFYQHFGGKDELLLALFEEFVSQFAEDIRLDLEGTHDSFDRLRGYIRGFLARIHGGQNEGVRALNVYTLKLAVERPDDYRRALAPQVGLVESIVRSGVEAGRFRTDLDVATMTMLLHATLVSAAQVDIFHLGPAGTQAATSESVWRWCRDAVSPSKS